MIKNKSNSRIEIRLPSNEKEKFQQYAKNNNTTMSKIIYDYIKKILLKESELNGKIN